MLRSLIIQQYNWLSRRYAQQLQQNITGVIKTTVISANTVVLKTTSNNLLRLLVFLKLHSHARYLQLIELTAEDTPTQRLRFRLFYIFSSFIHTHKLIVTCHAHELSSLPSVTNQFASAGWLEREVWDLFGIHFYNNRDLRRILTDYGFAAHPLRKDFPLTGFSEVYYSVDQRRIITAPVELAQEYRVFTY